MKKSALIIVDLQNDFCPGGTLAVKDGDAVVPVLNRYIEYFTAAGLMVIATRDWHPEKTVHFIGNGGVWPVHCVKGTHGAEIHPGLRLPPQTVIVTKGERPDEDSYSGFEGKGPSGEKLADMLREAGVEHLYIGGLATDYCVSHTALDGLDEGFAVTVLTDAVKGVDIRDGDSEKALERLRERGAATAVYEDLAQEGGEAGG